MTAIFLSLVAIHISYNLLVNDYRIIGNHLKFVWIYSAFIIIFIIIAVGGFHFFPFFHIIVIFFIIWFFFRINFFHHHFLIYLYKPPCVAFGSIPVPDPIPFFRVHAIRTEMLIWWQQCQRQEERNGWLRK